MRRLSFIRYLYTVAIEQSRQPLPMGAVSILSFHDTVELFLQLAVEHYNVGKKRMQFEDYFTELERVIPGGTIPGKAAMLRLNNARVGLKHHGNLPAPETIADLGSNTTTFFQANTPLIFGIDFDAISLVNLVQSAAARISLEEAEQLMNGGKLQEVCTKIAVAFEQLIDDFKQQARSLSGRSLFYFGRSVRPLSAFSQGIKERPLKDMADNIEKLSEAMRTVQSALEILSLGLDYRRYSKFRLLAPLVFRNMGGGYTVAGTPSETLTQEDCRFCFDFVIESALRLQEFDFEARATP